MRVWGLLGATSLLFLSAPVTSAAASPVLPVNFDQTVYGDFVVIGNTVTACPSHPGHHPVKACHDAQNQIGTGPSAQNNGHPMTWADVDADPATYNSSSARLTIPPGARIAYAKLTWAGNTGGPATVPCGRGPARPPGSPKQQQVSLKVNDRGGLVAPERYTEDAPEDLTPTNHQFYSAYADVTGQFRGITGSSVVTVGNVWTPQGFDCFGGWSLTGVWTFDSPHREAPGRKQITVFDAHTRVLTGKARAEARMPSIRSAGGLTRVGVTGFEGDWAVSGDRFLVNGRDAGRSGNFFVSGANGPLDPAKANNMSVDARTVDLENGLPAAGDTGADLAFTSSQDAYLVANVVASSGRPELQVSTSMDKDVAHPGDHVTQSVMVTNTGSAPAVDIRVQAGIGSACEQDIARLEAGQQATYSCTRPAPEDDVKPAAQVTGRSLIDDRLAGSATTFLEVLRPGITVTKTAVPDIVLSGQTVGYTIELRNTGDTALSGVTVDDKQVQACDRADAGTLASGQSETLRCSVNAGDDGFTNEVTVSGTDRAGKKVSANANATFTVIHPRIEFTVRPNTRAARAGETVTFTVTLRNPTSLPLRAVKVTGTPAACARDIGELAPQQTVEYSCSVVMRQRFTTSLTVTATPVVSGQLAEIRQDTISLTSAVVVSLVEPTPEPPGERPRERPGEPPALSPAESRADSPAVREAAESKPLRNAPVAVYVAGLAAITTFVTIGVISATARPKK
ncbi:DUF11 domain-containing protein [Kibdelosporangium persicum]|uniref:CARDB domain-containing protein n=1 Tax=Kibdelosporangium persicum TaxID=2698649 RepID=A0ABX2EZU0_9PSEU|nr:DUF11 domain-containing protein [Kibdelosporangium persicum]NRN64217.1 CARDB domain-containing protein [Kibdelosporangium persicum]